MSLWSFIKKVGAVISWPFKHEQMIEEVYTTVKDDLPPTLAAAKDLAKMVAAAGPDVLAAIAAKGFDVPDDIKSALDLKGIATFAKDTLLPTVEKDFTDLKAVIEGETTAPAGTVASTPAAPAPATAAAPPAPGPTKIVASGSPLATA